MHPTTRAGSHRTRALVLVEIVAALVAGLIGLAIGGFGGTLLGGTLLGGTLLGAACHHVMAAGTGGTSGGIQSGGSDIVAGMSRWMWSSRTRGSRRSRRPARAREHCGLEQRASWSRAERLPAPALPITHFCGQPLSSPIGRMAVTSTSPPRRALSDP